MLQIRDILFPEKHTPRLNFAPHIQFFDNFFQKKNSFCRDFVFTARMKGSRFICISSELNWGELQKVINFLVMTPQLEGLVLFVNNLKYGELHK